MVEFGSLLKVVEWFGMLSVVVSCCLNVLEEWLGVWFVEWIMCWLWLIDVGYEYYWCCVVIFNELLEVDVVVNEVSVILVGMLCVIVLVLFVLICIVFVLFEFYWCYLNLNV